MRSTTLLALLLVSVSCCGGSAESPSSSSSSSALVCLSWRDCPEDLHCDAPTQGAAACGHCVEGMPEGSDCGRFLFAHEPVGCGKGLACVPDTTSRNGATCRSRRRLAEGEACEPGSKETECGPGLECGGPHVRCMPIPAPGSVPKGGSCKVYATPAECMAPYKCARGVCDGEHQPGEECDFDRPCASGLVCTRSRVCSAPFPDGTPCRSSEECASTACAIDPNDNSNGMCVKGAGKGEPCGSLSPCLPDFSCSEDRGVCVTSAKVGEPCNDLAICSSSEAKCVDGVCQSTRALTCGR